MYYKEIETCSDETIKNLWNALNNAKADDWWRENNNVEWRISITPDMFINDPQTTHVLNKFVEPRRCYIQRLESNTCYNWHSDYDRDCSLTMCLNVYDKSYTLFAQPPQGNHIRDMHPLNYNTNAMYLIDGSKPHCGFNFSNETRYLVSISVTKPYTLPIVLTSLKNQFPDVYKNHI
jgi:hypothetical protein